MRIVVLELALSCGKEEITEDLCDLRYDNLSLDMYFLAFRMVAACFCFRVKQFKNNDSQNKGKTLIRKIGNFFAQGHKIISQKACVTPNVTRQSPLTLDEISVHSSYLEGLSKEVFGRPHHDSEKLVTDLSSLRPGFDAKLVCVERLLEEAALKKFSASTRWFKYDRDKL
jgi:hypothetical protein